ncbi:MAG: tetratricopeptide repeat protein [Oscillospiraceae bacterium]|nr:tetratricopeptide repeat protein [Oscillospiraceae bacterium]
MGDRLRRQGRRFLAAAYDAALPAMLMYLTMLLSLILRGVAFAEGVPLRFFFAALIVCYVTAYPITLIVNDRRYGSTERVDEHLIGDVFGGFSKRDKLFCRGLELLSKAKPRLALECFRTVSKEFPLEKREKGVCAYYLGRCYHVLRCPSNAIGFYREALENGFSEILTKMFLARAYSDNGDFDESRAIYEELLKKKIPETMRYVCTDLGYLSLKQYQPETAVKWFQKALENQESYPAALGGMSVALLQQGKFRKARTMATLAVTNHMPDASSFREYFSEVEQALLAEHPDWDAAEGCVPPEQDPPIQQGGATDGSI